MKIARFRVNGKTSYGEVKGERVTRIKGGPFGGRTLTKESYPLSSVKLLYPTQPVVMWASSTAMYDSHSKWIMEMWPERMRAAASAPPRPPSPGPQVDFRSAGALTNPGDPIVIPPDAKLVHWESEVVIVIGKKCRSVSKKDADKYILGYTIGNDVSERVWQWDDASFWRSKNSDTFKPVGPCIDTDVNYRDLVVTTRVNEKQVQQYKTADSKYDPGDFISFMSTYLTLYPGDMIFMGAEGAPTEIKPGDVVEIDISGIGTLHNPVVAGK